MCGHIRIWMSWNRHSLYSQLSHLGWDYPLEVCHPQQSLLSIPCHIKFDTESLAQIPKNAWRRERPLERRKTIVDRKKVNSKSISQMASVFPRFPAISSGALRGNLVARMAAITTYLSSHRDISVMGGRVGAGGWPKVWATSSTVISDISTSSRARPP